MRRQLKKDYHRLHGNFFLFNTRKYNEYARDYEKRRKEWEAKQPTFEEWLEQEELTADD